MTNAARPHNRQGRPRKWGEHCWECRRHVKTQWMRHGLCAACYQRGRRAGTITTDYVDPAPARDHLAEIYATGKSYRWIAGQAGTSTVNLNHVAKNTRRRISRELADKILAVPVPEHVDEQRLKYRLLQTAGIRGLYVGVGRSYRRSRTDRAIPSRRRDPKRHSLREEFHAERERFLAQFDTERDEFMRWLYEGTGAPIKPINAPARVRQFNLALAMCGDCERWPCACLPVDYDLWLVGLADHDMFEATA